MPFSALFGTLWMNQKRFRHAVFWKWSEIISFTFWPSFGQIVRAIFEKKSKNCHFDHFFVLYGWTGFFFKNPAVWHILFYRYLSACQVSSKSLEPFSQSPPSRHPSIFWLVVPPLTWRTVYNSASWKGFDLRFFASAQNRSPLYSDAIWAKSLFYFLRKVQKTPKNDTF